MSNSGAVTAAPAEREDVNGKAEMESAATAAVSVPTSTKCKKKKKRKQEVANAEEGVTVVQEAAPAGVAVLALEGTPISKKKKEKAKGREMVEQEATTAAVPALEGIPKSKKKKEKAKEQEIVEPEATTAAVSAAEGTPKCKKKKKKAKEAANAEESGMVEQEAASVEAAAVSALEGTQKSKKKKKEKANEWEMVEPEATTAAVSAAEEGTPKCKKKKKKAKEAANAESGTVEQEAASVEAAAVSALEGTPKSKKKNKKKEKAKEQETVEQEATTAAVSADEGAPKCKKKKAAKDAVNAEENGTVEHEAASVAAAAVLAFEGTPKSKKKKEKAKEREMVEQEATTTAVSAEEGTPKCKKKKEEKARRIVEQGPTTAAVSALEGTPSCKKNEEKAEVRGMGQQDATTATVSALEGALKCKKKKKEKIKETGSDEVELSAAISALEGTQKYQNKEKGNETGLANKQETTTDVSASERTPKLKKKLKKKNKMQEQEESPQALSSPMVDKILASKPGNGCTNGEAASVDADFSMDPINGEDPNCSEVKDTNEEVKYKAGEENKDFSENCSSLLEISEDRKRPRRKRKHDGSNRGPGISSQDGDRVVKRCMDYSTEHDLSCVCASCLVGAHKEKVTNIYSPRGSLIRFQRKKLLILDLNGLLADINMDYRNAHRAHAKVKAKLVFKRPYYDDFLRFCFQNFELGIWSSRNKDNVNSVVNILMRDLKQYLLFCWDMSHCTVTGRNTVENKHKPLVLKELKKLWNKEYPNLPWEQGEFSPSNTLLVDDSPYKALCNPPHTAIFPQPYSYLKERSDYSLGPGGDLRVYLERLAVADDVQVFVRENPFGQPYIMESDPHWNFYAQIVDRVEKSLA